jgi:hypothetical protein
MYTEHCLYSITTIQIAVRQFKHSIHSSTNKSTDPPEFFPPFVCPQNVCTNFLWSFWDHSFLFFQRSSFLYLFRNHPFSMFFQVFLWSCIQFNISEICKPIIILFLYIVRKSETNWWSDSIDINWSCVSWIFKIKVRKKYVSLHLNTDFSVLNFDNFQVTAFALHSSTQINQCLRIMLAALAWINFPMKSLSLFLSMMKDEMALQLHFCKYIYENFSLKKDLISKKR